MLKVCVFRMDDLCFEWILCFKRELVSHMYNPEEISKLLEESAQVATRRKEAQEMLKVLICFEWIVVFRIDVVC